MSIERERHLNNAIVLLEVSMAQANGAAAIIEDLDRIISDEEQTCGSPLFALLERVNGAATELERALSDLRGHVK